ncbi:GNAT family N-acetyltransferase [Longispora sp. NPDC051575]|uniref:GNAT family N-acetyltransferase n=1 Tax=Longispora sp. NPDC051575 TaxID=3154943 RepID=UPI003440AFCD
MIIRSVPPEERPTVSLPIQQYAFSATPGPSFPYDARYHRDNAVLAAYDGDRVLACATRIPMTQNVRGGILRMAAVAGVAAVPDARRGGHVRALLDRQLADAAAEGFAVSTLYPFRTSFYERFGYVSFPEPARVSIDPASLAPLLRADLPGEVTWHPVADAYDDLRDLHARLQRTTHGVALRPDYSAEWVRDGNESWAAVARVAGEVVGALLYRITGHHGELSGGPLLAVDPTARALLLSFLARHVDQVDAVTLTPHPDERPELWSTDIAVTGTVRSTPTDVFAPMARVLSVPALAGIGVGAGDVTVAVDDPLTGGTWRLGSDGGALVVRPSDAEPEATLTGHGLSALVYGVLDPAELAVRGFAPSLPADVADRLRTLFPKATPWLVENF